MLSTINCQLSTVNCQLNEALISKKPGFYTANGGAGLEIFANKSG
ncbi:MULTISPECIES: hypothetical protein [unclassified Microcoleus]|nr:MULTISPECIES: hypothetical protein [unclassified Microcoleus]